MIHINSTIWNIDTEKVDEGCTLEMTEQQDKKSGSLNTVELSHPYAWKVMWERN